MNGRIKKITTKTHDSNKAAMGKNGRLFITICGYVKFEHSTVYQNKNREVFCYDHFDVHRSQSLDSCCFIEPMTIKSGSHIQVSYKRNEVDVFAGRALRQCEGVQLKQIKRLKIRNLHIEAKDSYPDGWHGDYIDIGFNNGTRFCDIELTDMNVGKFD